MPRSARHVLGLYRDIMRAVKHYPSSKRDSIAREIVESFHANKGIRDPIKIDAALQQADIGLSELRQWLPRNLEDESGSWSVQLRGNTLTGDAEAESQIKGR
jgi:Complex 1 protein (LYR family)